MTDLLNLPHDAVVAATVNSPAEVTLYDDQGVAVRVDGAMAEYFVTRGFSRVQTDPDGTFATVEALWEPTRDAFRRAHANVTETGQIETHPDAALHTAAIAFGVLAQAVGAWHRAMHAKYPTLADPRQHERDSHPDVVREQAARAEWLRCFQSNRAAKDAATPLPYPDLPADYVVEPETPEVARA